jgi:hypothetical protein
VATSFDGGSKNFYVMGVNRSSSATHQFTLDLTSWDVRPGSVISVEEVSANHSADVTRFVTVPANKQVTLTQPTQSVWLLTAPSGAVQTQLNFLATDDAQVRNSTTGDPSYRTTNFGQDTTTGVARSASTAAGDMATYMKFDLGSLSPSNVSRAILWVTGQNITSSAAELFHVYGITDNNWNESSLTWATAPGLSSSTDAKMTGVGTSAFPRRTAHVRQHAVGVGDRHHRLPAAAPQRRVVVRAGARGTVHERREQQRRADLHQRERLRAAPHRVRRAGARVGRRNRDGIFRVAGAPSPLRAMNGHRASASRRSGAGRLCPPSAA